MYVAEDRLKATLIGGGFILPVAVLALGWTFEKASGKGGLAAAVILLFIDGVGLMVRLSPCDRRRCWLTTAFRSSSLRRIHIVLT